MQRKEGLVHKGKNAPLSGVLQQGQYSHDLALKYAKEVGPCGFTEKERERLGSNLALLGTESVARLENRASSKAKRVAEAKAIAASKKFKRRLDAALATLYAREQFENEFHMPVAEEVFQVSTPRGLRNSSPKVIEYLMKIRPHVATLKEQLAPFFDGGDAVAKLDEVLSALKSADAIQEISRANLTEETLDVLQLKGEVIFLVEWLNRAGRTAFDGDANKVGLFNKDLLLRARRTGVEAVEEGEKAEAAS